MFRWVFVRRVFVLGIYRLFCTIYGYPPFRSPGSCCCHETTKPCRDSRETGVFTSAKAVARALRPTSKKSQEKFEWQGA